jgi:hypothetical protein
MGKKVVFTFGRFQVPTRGHEELVKFVMSYARSHGAEGRIYPSKSHDNNKNPLPYPMKVQFLRQLFPWANIIDDPKAINAFAICRELSNKGYDDVTFVVGEDRVPDFENQINKYVLPKTDPKFDPRKHYAFKSFKVISSGARHEGVSGTVMRQFIRQGKFDQFMKVAPTNNKVLAKRIFNSAKQNLAEERISSNAGMTRKEFDKLLNSFVDYSCKYLNINEKPALHYKDDKGEGQPSFGGYAPHNKQLMVYTKHRHPMDILRTVAHELVHHKQNEDGRLGKDIAKEGATGSEIENQANSMAGEIMRHFGKKNPFCFDMQYVTEQKAIVLAGTPGSGKDKILKEGIMPFGFIEMSPNRIEYEENVVVTGSFTFNDIKELKEELVSNGYDTMLVFVNTSNETSKIRNEERGKRGGRVISETARFAKWQDAQDIMEKSKNLFEKYVIIDNSVDANTIKEAYDDAIHFLGKHIHNFMTTEIDHRFEQMLEEYADFSSKPKNNPVGGAGNWGTSKLTDRYKSDTPGQEPGKTRSMGYYAPKVFGNLPIKADRVGATFTSAKNPSFVGDITSDTNTFVTPEPMQLWSPIDRWMVKEETRKRFKAKYGALAEKKLRETAEKLNKEGMEDPAGGYSAMVSSTGGPPETVDNFSRIIYDKELEKKSLFGKLRKYKKD